MTQWQILVVDDELLNLEIIGEFLDDPIYKLTQFESADEAWAHLQATKAQYDLVLLDRMMPGMDGITFLRQFKSEAMYKHVPVIMQTAAASPDEVREGMNAGAYYYLAKPYGSHDLLASVHSALDEVAQLRQALAHAKPIVFDKVGEYSFATLNEARELAVSLGGLCPTPETATLGLTELLVNAVEHGNLEISYAEKTRLRLADQWEEEIERRLSLPEYAERKASVHVERAGDMLRFRVTDCGKGFDWQKYLDFCPERGYDPNGRGIAMARQLSFVKLEYEGCGNIVTAVVSLNGDNT